jgi:hypothetical protein
MAIKQFAGGINEGRRYSLMAKNPASQLDCPRFGTQSGHQPSAPLLLPSFYPSKYSHIHRGLSP